MADQVCRMAIWLGRLLAVTMRAGQWRDNGDIKARGGTIFIKDEIHACMFNLAIHHTSEGWDGLLDGTLRRRCVCASHQQGIWPLRHACDQYRLRIDTRSSGAVARPPICHRSDPLRLC